MNKSNAIGSLIVIGLWDFMLYNYKIERNNARSSINEERDYAYEAYCDSIRNADEDYYLNVLLKTEEYQLYIESHGVWWTNNQ